MEPLLNKLYFNPAHPAGYSNHQKLYKHAVKVNKNITYNQVNDYLKAQDSYTLFRQRRLSFNTAGTSSCSIDLFWQCDLCDMSNLSDSNNFTKYLLFCIDVFSRYLWVVALKDKKSSSITNAFSSVFKEGRLPGYIVTDEGTEFKGDTKNYLTMLNITQYTLHGPSKCGIVERVQKTIKSKIFRYLYGKNTKKYIDILPKIIQCYNNTIHRMIKTTPLKKSLSKKYFSSLNLNTKCKKKDVKFKINDYVRVSRQPFCFEKSYEGTFNIEIFIITRVLCRSGVTVYHIKDLNNKTIKGIFYNHELQKVKYKDNDLFKIEKILSEKNINGKKYFKIRWLGYTKKFDSLIPASDLINV